jgi:class 3 adenylate cyclase/pimeloyl-ACP methyl ester carboxylesterase
VLDEPAVHYARCEDGVHIAYQVFGDGPTDLVVVHGFVSHLEQFWESPQFARLYRQLGSFARVITFDKRGTGLSDRTPQLPDIDRRMLDLRAVIDAVGSERPSILGISEGGAMSILYAATYPERVRSLVLYGSFAMPIRTDDHPVGITAEQLRATRDYFGQRWGTGVGLAAWAPSLAGDEDVRKWWARFQRLSASPGAAIDLMTSYNLVDVRPALPLVRAPTLVLHRRDDRMVDVRLGREIAAGIADARIIEYPGADHFPPTTNIDDIVDDIADFVTGSAPDLEPDRRLATVLFTDIVSSTEQLGTVGDATWRDVLDRHDHFTEAAVQRHGGTYVKHTGDGALALFDGPSRAVRCARSITSADAGAGVAVRAGLHTGEIVQRGDDISGIAVHLAQRVSSEAAGGEVLVSRTVVDLVTGSGLRFTDRGEHQLKGIDTTWHLFAATDG